MSSNGDTTLPSSELLVPEQASEQQQRSGGGECWSISFASTTKKRKVSRKEQLELDKQQQQRASAGGGGKETPAGTDDDGDAGAATDDVLSSDELIPRNLLTTAADLLTRLHIDIPRLLCVAKQYPRSCGITSLVSVWNHLYSCIGQGTLPPVSQEEAMTILGFYPPFDAIRWGPFTGNTTLFRWFHSLNRHFGVAGKAYYLWKVRGLGRTPGVTSEKAQELFCDAIRNPKCGVVYHCHNHYMVPVGYQRIPRHQSDCYRANVRPDATEMTVFIGEVSRGKHPAMHAVKWRDIDTDLNTASPQFFNIRNPHLGIQTRGEKKAKKSDAACTNPPEEALSDEQQHGSATAAKPATTRAGGVRGELGGNLHCLLMFRSDMVEEDFAQFECGPQKCEVEDEDEDGDVLVEDDDVGA